MNKIKLGVDVDEVVLDFFKGYLDLFNKKFNKNLRFEDLVNYHIWELTDISKEDSLALAHEIHISEHPEKVTLIDGARESLINLDKKYEIHFITSRSERYRENTFKILKELFNKIQFNLHFSQGVWGKSKTKGEVCKNLGIKIMIEDNVNYALSCAEVGVKTFLLEKPWNNNHKPHENIIKVKSWPEILRYLNQNSKKNENTGISQIN